MRYRAALATLLALVALVVPSSGLAGAVPRTITGSVRDAYGGGVGGVSLVAISSELVGSPKQVTAVTDPSGVYRVEVDPGSWNVRLTDPRFVPVSGDVSTLTRDGVVDLPARYVVDLQVTPRLVTSLPATVRMVVRTNAPQGDLCVESWGFTTDGGIPAAQMTRVGFDDSWTEWERVVTVRASGPGVWLFNARASRCGDARNWGSDSDAVIYRSDQQPPQIAVTTPAEGRLYVQGSDYGPSVDGRTTVVGAKVPFAADAADDQELAAVVVRVFRLTGSTEQLVDQRRIAVSGTSAHAETSITDPWFLAGGRFRLEAVAVDAQGNESAPSSVAFVVVPEARP